MMIPTVHLNGTGATTLLTELETAHTAIDAAIDALRQVTVHGRDYYPQGDVAYTQARREMDARLAALDAVNADLATMHADITRQAAR